MGLWGLLDRYLTQRLIPWKPQSVGSTVWVEIQQAV